ncbi:MAG TPA: hypothetical protein VKR59_10200, partial [Terriglobales bacterium]|nr:hypothetical protein [Terriglobales bacterium]
PSSSAAEFQPRPALVNPDLAWIANLSEDEFRSNFRGSPLRRAKRVGLRRNALTAMGNSGNPEFLPILDRVAQDHDEEESVAEAARWAANKLRSLCAPRGEKS